MPQKWLLILFLSLLLSAEAYFGYRLHVLSAQQEQIKADHSDINNITLGLFSVDQWEDKIAGIVNHQVRQFKLTPQQKQQLLKEIEKIIYALIDKAEAIVNKPQKSLGAKLKKLAVKTFVKTDKIRAQVPSFARTILKKVDDPRQKSRLSSMAMDKFDDVQHSKTMDSTLKANHKQMEAMFNKYHVSSHKELNKKLSDSLASIRTKTYSYCFGMLGCVAAVLMVWWICRKRTDLHVILFIMSLLFAFILLAVGLTASMIEVDARIATLDFTLLGEHVLFSDQVLFYQSKSILDVVKVLISQSAIDSVAVGVLILCFSILFPIMKLTSTGIHLLGRKKLAENKVIKYFAFQSGKWSMADVIVIAVLMTFIGLNGLLDKQLALLNINSADLTVLTTNNTALQPGFIVFISFVLYGLILSTILKFITPHDAH
ncbi:paraquat-inducible protein A [Mucilaginibacter daejeonensis]|uniref:paraquat-inducible protein A n=1 Tax=Mucilaginibacter daejeonensis TaxID=398049 RepID=UPI001D171B5E|nr:paraquat-inducible protein A [Mucilaginibacter daejeonensis]UEG51938.1 paraquat-inducible protein A [Mucilaginibacter daejeonensis]